MVGRVIAVLLTIGGVPALGDGFVCQSVDHPVEISVYNHVHRERGTRRAAVMVVSDLTVRPGRRTVAVFRDSAQTLSNSGSLYTGRVDLRSSELGRGGEVILGTRLANLRSVRLKVNFRFGEVLPVGARRSGYLTLIRRDGRIIEDRLVCKRYLKSGANSRE